MNRKNHFIIRYHIVALFIASIDVWSNFAVNAQEFGGITSCISFQFFIIIWDTRYLGRTVPDIVVGAMRPKFGARILGDCNVFLKNIKCDFEIALY